MYAVTAHAQEYTENHQKCTGTVILHLVETVEDSENSFNIFWFNDGSDTGCLVISDESGYIPMSRHLDNSDVFSPEQLETISEQEETVIPARFGVRIRTVDSVYSIEDWLDYSEIERHGSVRIDRWSSWQHLLAA